MKANKKIDRLTQQMASLRASGKRPLILFLGEEYARAAGVPGVEKMALQVFGDLFKRDREMATSYLSAEDWTQAQQEQQSEEWLLNWREPPPGTRQLVAAFYKWLNGLSNLARYGVVQRFYSRVASPRPYQDLAALIRDGYFDRIVTTNIDTLLEAALNLVGLRRDKQQVITLDVLRQSRRSQKSNATVRIVKFQGHQKWALNPDEIQEALDLKGGETALDNGIVMVGLELPYEPLNDWLKKMSGEVWWVSDQNPPSDLMAEKPLHIIDSQSVKLDEFFGQLALRLLRRPMPIYEWDVEEWDVDQSWDTLLKKWHEKKLQRRSSNGYSEIEYLQDQLERSRSVLYRLSSAGERNVQTQIDYQSDEIAKLEGLLLLHSQNEVVRLIDQIINSVQQAGTDFSTLSFLQNQVTLIKDEYKREQPNQNVLKAAILGVVSLADHLGSEVVDPKLVRKVANFAPGGRVVSVA